MIYVQPVTLHLIGVEPCSTRHGAIVRSVSAAFYEFDPLPTVFLQVDDSEPEVNRLLVPIQSPDDLTGIVDGAGGGTFAYIGTAVCWPAVWHVYDGGEE